MKLKTVIVIGLVFGLLCGSAISAFKVGTDGTGQRWGWVNNDDGYITTSSGKAYPATDAGLRSALSTECTVYLPACNITLTKPLNISKNQHLKGSGMNTSILWCYGIKINGYYWSVEDLTIGGNTTGNGITIINANKGYIKNVYTYNHGGSGIDATGCIEVLFEKVDVKYNGVDGCYMYGDSNANTFIGCTFEANTRSGLHWSNSAGLALTGCIFEDNRREGCWLWTTGVGSRGVSISGCYFEDNSAGGSGSWSDLYIGSSNVNNRMTGVSVSGCFFVGFGATADAIGLARGAKGISVSGCEFQNYNRGVFSAFATPSGIVVTGNYFNNTVSETQFVGAATRNYTVNNNDGNTYKGTESYGTCTIAAGGRTVVVNHNLTSAPKIVIVTPITNLSAGNPAWQYSFWTDTYTATQFTLSLTNKTTPAKYFAWYARV